MCLPCETVKGKGRLYFPGSLTLLCAEYGLLFLVLWILGTENTDLFLLIT